MKTELYWIIAQPSESLAAFIKSGVKPLNILVDLDSLTHLCLDTGFTDHIAGPAA